jgi:hypothetical protein
MSMSTTTRLKLFGVLGMAAGIALAGATCGGGVTTPNDTRESARDKATTATCDRYMQCGLIGPDTTDAYATYDSCKISWQATWEQRWPIATCHAINQPGLAVCLSAIAATSCDVVDLLLTLGKCEEVDVCLAAPADAGGN